jgi:hypothetical protein
VISGRGALLAIACLGFATAAAAAIAPLWVYALSLAAFGLPHVLTELRYVDERFALRTTERVRAGLVLLLLAVVAVRLAGLGGVGTTPMRIGLELALGVVLVLWPLLQVRGLALWPGLLLAAALAWGTATAPATTMVLFALLHNLTPIGLLAERLRGRDRRRALLGCVVVFVLVPLAMLLLPPPAVLHGPLGTGELDQHLAVFVPERLHGGEAGDRLFAIAAWWQCVHYAIVLHVLPRLGGGPEGRAWPRPQAFARGVLVAGAVMALAFASGFGTARAAYGVLAAVHAWIELPVLALAAGAIFASPRAVRAAASSSAA